MKIDRSKLKKNSSEPPGDCSWLIERLRTCSDEELLPLLMSIETWSYGKCELHHWVDVLDRFDSILETATKGEENKWVLPCNKENNAHMLNLVIYVLHFTTLLVEHSFSRHLYSSVEHLITLLSSSAMSTVLAVLNLLYMFSKRSNFITRLACEPRGNLLCRLVFLAESWGGKENGFGLAHCCKELPLSSYPDGATSLSFEYYSEQSKPDVMGSPVTSKGTANVSNRIHIPNVHQIEQCCSHIMEEILGAHKVPEIKQMLLFTHLRLAQSFGRYDLRLQCVQARLQAISILVYCNALQDCIGHTVLYSGLLAEFVDVLELKDARLTEIKAATLRTLTSIIHLERLPNFPKLNTVIEVTGASSYHGFLPVLVRSCIANLTSDPVEPNPFPTPLATSLFSFLYHLASYESGGEALVTCAMMESLLSVVNWIGTENDHITFVTRAVRVIDLITNLDMNAFQNHGGPKIFIKRLEFEVEQCRKEQPFVIQLPVSQPRRNPSTADDEMPENATDPPKEADSSPMEGVESLQEQPEAAGLTLLADASSSSRKFEKLNVTCLPQRAALLKSMLNFLKKDIQDPGFNDHLNLRHLMEGSLPNSLKHIISNAEYYGPSLFLLATDVVTAYVYGEPSLLSFLQENGLTDVVLHALLIKDVPATREVLASLPNVFSALCLNAAGLQSFVERQPFDRLFKVLLSPDYLPAMRRRRSSEPMGDTASNLGSAMDELMRHQPSLKAQAMKAIVKLLHDLCLLGVDSHYVCTKANTKTEEIQASVPRNTTTDSSSDEEEDDDEGESASNTVGPGILPSTTCEDSSPSDKRSVPLVDYVLNIMKFVDAILSNNSTDDHCKEFVTQKGLAPLLAMLGLPNLPIDFATSQACLSVASVCKSIMSLSQEKGVLQQGLECLLKKLQDLSPLNDTIPYPGGSILLKELAASANPQDAINSPQSTPLLHSLSAVHAYTLMLSQVCRTSQHEIRHMAIKQWGSELGLKVLTSLSQLYTSVTSEAAILFAICTEGSKDAKESNGDRKSQEGSSSQSMETAELEQANLTRFTFNGCPFDATSSKIISSSQEMKLLKPLLQTTIRLAKTLGDLFTLLVKLCVGSPPRQRRGQQIAAAISPPTPAGIPVAGRIANLMHIGLSWSHGGVPGSLPRFQKAFFVCSLRFFSPLLFDDKKMPYHFILYQFVDANGLKAFFDAFEWALATEDVKDKPDESSIADMMGEFLDAWLVMLEKLVNPTNMLDSPYSLPPKHPFCPLRFLIHIHKRAFDAIMKLWNRKPIRLPCGVKISETMLSILCFILKGESIINDRLAKEKKEPTVPGSVSPTIASGGSGIMDAVALSVPPAVPLSVQALPAVNEIRLSSLMQANQATSPSELESSFPRMAMTPSGVIVRFGSPNPDAADNSIPDAVAATPENSSSPAVADATPQDIELPAENPPATTSDTPSVPIAVGEESTSATTSEGAPVASAVTDESGSARTTGSDATTASATPAGGTTESTTAASRGATAFTDPTQSLWLQSLLDMGFALDRCVEAISYCNTLEQATEYLLTNQGMDSDMDYSEDDQQWFQAVTMSLKEHQQPTTVKPAESSVSAAVVENEKLSKEKLDEFCSTILDGCLEQLDVQHQLVYKASFLIATCVARNGKQWQENMLRKLMTLVMAEALKLSKVAVAATDADTAKYLCSSENASKFGIRLHLLTLLFEEMKSGCTNVLQEHDIVDVLINLLCHTEMALCANPQIIRQFEEKRNKDKKNNPKETPDTHLGWLSPCLLLLDLYEKLSISQKRKAAVKEVTNYVWKWFDANAIKWYSYGGNNKVINDAYWAGEGSVRIVNGRRKYLIQFNSMVQVNEESHYRRPVMIGICDKAIASHQPPAEDGTAENSSGDEADTKEPTTKPTPDVVEDMEQEQSKQEETPEVSVVLVKGFTDEQQKRMIRACVGFMELGMEPDTLHALMMLSLRITRDWENARLFANMGGIKTLIGLGDKSGFWGFHTMLALLMRHILEEPSTLKNTMKKVVRYSASNTASLGSKELHSLLRTLAPAACRDAAMFSELTQQYLRIDLNMGLKRNPTAEEAIFMKSINTKGCTGSTSSQSNVEKEKQESKQLIYDLLEALVMNTDDSSAASGSKEAEMPSAFPKKDGQHFGVTQSDTRNLSHDLSRSSSANDMVVQELEDQSPMESDGSKVVGADSKVDEQPAKRKPLLTRPTVCRLLAEFVRSYAGVAKLITEHQYVAGITENIVEDCSAISYLLDQLMCGDVEMAALVKVLIAALASCNHAIEAQTALVSEIKCYFCRLMVSPESLSKHTKLQALIGIISTMIESCPSQMNPPLSSCIKQPGQQAGMNNIIKILIKKNVVTDLARISHCLDLSSPNMATTVNAALKPLENILRVVNTPYFVPAAKKKTAPHEDNQQQSENLTTNSEATRAQGEENTEDAENTDHDLSTTGESFEPINAGEDVTLGDNDEGGMNDIGNLIDHMLDDGMRGEGSQRRSGSRADMVATVAYVLDDTPMDTDDTLHDSRMVTQSDSQFLEETEGNNDDDDNSSASEEEEDNAAENNDDEDDDDDDDDDEDDDDDDGEDGEDDDYGSVYDGYEDLDEAFLQLADERDAPEDILLPSYQRYINTIDTIIFGNERSHFTDFPNNLQQMTSGLHNEDSLYLPSNTQSQAGGGLAASSVPTHPLFQNPRETTTTAASARVNYRPSRQRGVLRLLGQSQQEVLQLTSNLSNLRDVFITNGDGWFVHSDSDDFGDNQDSNNVTSAGRVSNSLPSVPNALTRWTEEARVLEFDSMHDAVTELKPALMAILEKHRKVEVAEREKKKREQEAQKSASKPAEDGEAWKGTLVDMPAPSLDSVLESLHTPQSDAPPPAVTSTATTTAVISYLQPPSSTIPPILLNLQEPTVRAVPEAGLNSMDIQPPASSVSSRTVADALSSAIRAATAEIPSGPVSTANLTVTTGSVPAAVSSLQESSDSRSSSDADMATLSSPNTSAVSSVDPRQADEEMCVSPPAYGEPDPNPAAATEAIPPVVMEQTLSFLEMGARPSSAATDEHKVEEANRLAEASAVDPPAATPSTSSAPPNEFTAILGDIEIPEGVDPSFLAALPEDMRREVISEQLRIQQVQRRDTERRQEGSTETPAEVSPEFLAALPPSIQEEVLAQQRVEQQRQFAARTSQDDPVSFFQTLPSTLRQTILADLEESQFSVLPPDVAREAQQLRTQREERTRNVPEHMFRAGGGGHSLSHILRHTARLGSRFLQSAYWTSSSSRNLRPNAASVNAISAQKIKGQQVLDCESVTCLLVLLFVDEPKLNTTRLHRVIKTLCYNQPTRDWIIKTLLSIIQRCAENNTNVAAVGEDGSSTMDLGAAPMASTPVSSSWKNDSKHAQQSTWLSMSIDAALVCRANIFQVKKITTGGKKNPGCVSATVNIHPQACPLVCRHIIDLLVSLSKSFPENFLPTVPEADKDKKATPKKSSTPSSSSSTCGDFPDFWEVLVKLDSINVSRKSKSVTKAVPGAVAETEDASNSLVVSPLGQLVQQLAHPVIKKSPLLTDRFLKLLSLMSQPLRDTQYAKKKGNTISDISIAGLERLLGLTIEVLTSKSCTEEGLEDITALVLHLSYGPPPTRDIVLKLLLQGTATLGQTVTSHIAALLVELKNYNKSNANSSQTGDNASANREQAKKGVLKDRFTREEVVISSLKTKQPCEIQLPSMSTLISKTSSQAFFLRTLKVINQLRDQTKVLQTMDRLEADAQRLNISLNTNNAAAPTAAEGELSQMDVSTPIEDLSTKAPIVDSPEAMEVDHQNQENELKSLSGELQLDDLWCTLSDCLVELGETPDTHAVLVLQPAVEAFFLVHAFSSSSDKKPKQSTNQETREAQLAHLHSEIAPLSPLPASGEEGESSKAGKTESSEVSTGNSDSEKFIKFGEMHRSVLNQILRQSSSDLSEGPFRVLVDHTRLLDFDIKRKYFRTELERADDGIRREDLPIHIRRNHVFEDSYRELHRRPPEEWKNRLYIVFEGEEGQDAGGLLREWYVIISREIFNPMYALFCVSPGDKVTYMINPASHCNSNHLSYFKFVGRVIAKAVYDNKLLECYFTRSFYKHILGKMVRVSDMEGEDYSFYQGLIYLIEHNVVEIGYDLYFSTQVQEFGVTEERDLKQDGRNIVVTEETKMEYIRLVCQEKMKGAIKQQLNSFLEGFYDIIPKRLISIFNEQELELLISGLPTIDIEDLKNNTEYHKYTATSLQIQWFWRSLRSFEQADRAKLIQFVTGTSKVPLQGFAALEGMNGVQKFQIHKDERSTDRLPSAHTCFNQVDLPVYETYDKLRHYLLKAIQECSEGFGFA